MANRSFTDLAAVRSEKERLRAKAAFHQSRLDGHWANLRQGSFRRRLMRRTVAGRLRDLVGGGAVAAAVPVMATGLFTLLTRTAGRNPWAKTGLAILGAVLPRLIERALEHRSDEAGEPHSGADQGGRVISELARSWERVKEHVRERRAARAGSAS